MDMPLWLLFFCGIFIGLVAGWIAAWMDQGKWRRATREARIELVRDRMEIVQLRRRTTSRVNRRNGTRRTVKLISAERLARAGSLPLTSSKPCARHFAAATPRRSATIMNSPPSRRCC